MGAADDITGRPQQEGASLESEARYYALFQNALEGIFRSTPEGHFTEVNPALVRMLGYASAEEVLALKLPDDLYVDPAQRTHLRANYETAGAVEGEELQWKKKNGEQIVVSLYARVIRDLHGRVVGYEGLVLDITARKRAEEALRESEARYRNLFENANDMLATFTLDGIITSVNRGLEVALGWSREELIGQHYSKLATPAALALANARTRRALAGEELSSIFAAEILRKDGTVVPIEVRSRFIRDAAGQPIGVQGIFRDLTERRRAEEVLATLSRQLLEAQEAERRHLAHELHDELGQELTALKLMLQMTKGTPQAVARRLQDSTKLVDDLLLQVRTLSLDLRPLMLDELGLRAALDWYIKRQAPRNGCVIHFVADALEPRPHPAIETACFRVVQEALTNVVRHAQAQHVWVEVGPHDSALLLRVRDDGIGFDLDTARAQAAQGKGLGLVGMEERVRLVGGQMEIMTEPGRGTEIRARFPLRETL